MKYVLGIDFGGGASKATLLSEDGKITATAFKEYATYAVADGGREQKPDEWLGAALDNIQTVIGVSGIDAKDIVCVCFDAATHTAVLLDEEFRMILTLRVLEDLSYEQIAEVMDLKVGTVKSRLARARTKLKNILTKDGNNSLDKTSNLSEYRGKGGAPR